MMFKLLPLLASMVVPPGEPTVKDFEEALQHPDVGDHELRVLAPRLLELHLVTTQDPPGGWEADDGRLFMLPPLTRPKAWDFLDRLEPMANAPSKDTLQVDVAGQPAAIERVGFRRRTLYAKKGGDDLRVGHSIYVLLEERVPSGARVVVTDADNASPRWLENLTFECDVLPNRYSPMIHVNTVGYAAEVDGLDRGVKKAYLSYMPGDLGRLLADEERGEWVIAPVTLEDGPSLDEAWPIGLQLNTAFEVIDAETSAVVYQSSTGAFTVRKDNQWATYDGVLEMDFSDLVTPGKYRLRVPGFGASMPFMIGEQMPKQLTRTFALGLYHQRSGQDHALPHTRFIDPPSHLAPATMPFDDHQYFFPYSTFSRQSNPIFVNHDKFASHPAPQIRSPESLLFPYTGDVVAWWPMDGKEVVHEENVIAGFNALTYADSINISDPFGGHPDGNAFGDRPARSAFPGRDETDARAAITPQQSFQNSEGQGYGELNGFYGVGFINTYQVYDPVDGEENPPATETRATGILETGSFVISEPWIGFLIGGSEQPYDLTQGGEQLGVTAVNLLIDGVTVRTATGSDRNILKWNYWDVQDLQGQTATLQIIDSSSTGFLLVDEFMQTKRNSLRDISSYRNAATLLGNGEFTSEQNQAALGQALYFDGVDDSVEAHALNPLADSEAFTISLWVKFDSLDRDQIILAKGDDFALTYRAESMNLEWRVGEVSVTSPREINNSAWHFLSASFEAGASDGLRLWVDELVHAATASTSALSAFPHSSANLVMGGAEGQLLHGGLDDVRIRASIVSDEELLDGSTGSGPWIDVSLGHFDAGDYGKYMINSALALHTLTFTADALLELSGTGSDPAPLDNLGIPESGDGIPDILQEAKWEADYIEKMQDSDGGFFFLVHPRSRSFEDDVLPSQGDPQVVWPKTLSATGAAVGALVEIASSPSFQHYYPEAATRYLEAGHRGWDFILRAVDKYGVAGGWQRLTHYGQGSEARDEIAWAAAALFAATGDAQYEARMKEWMPWNSDTVNGIASAWREFRRHTWQRLYESTGAAMRVYLFANRGARSGRPINFDPTLVGPKSYHEHIRDELIDGAEDLLTWADLNPYRASVPTEAKRFGNVTYFFGISEAFDLATAYVIDPKPAYFEGMINNIDYVLGANAVNRSFVSGLGWSQNREYVSQFANNDERQLPPIGYNVGGVNTGMPWLLEYQGLLSVGTYPLAVDESFLATPYGVYDRQTDVWNVSNEFVIWNQTRAFGVAAYLYHFTEAYDEPWTPAPEIQITGAPARADVGEDFTLQLSAPNANLDEGRILWEASDQSFDRGTQYQVHTGIARTAWVEAEVSWPDGKRSFARTSFPVTEQISQEIEKYQPTPSEPGPGVYGKILGNRNVRLYYPLDRDFDDVMKVVRERLGAEENPYKLVTTGNPIFDSGNFEWPGYLESRPDFRPLRISASEDIMQVDDRSLFIDELFPPHTKWISMEAIVFIDEFNQNGSAAYMPGLDIEGLAEPTRLWLYKDPWDGPIYGVYGKTQVSDLNDIVPLKRWIHLRAVMDREHTTTYLNGEQIDQVPTESFDAWLERGRRIKVLLGGFQGYVSDLVIKAGTGQKESLDEPVPAPLSRFEEWTDWALLGDTGPDSFPDSDPDGDGRSNLLEYALNSSPTEADRLDLPLQFLESQAGRFTLRYRRPRDEDRPELRYAITYSSDMETWEQFNPPLEASQATEDVFGMVTYDFEDNRLQPDSTTLFLRLEVSVD